MNKLVKIVLVIFCLIGIYVFLMSISPKKYRVENKNPPVLNVIKLKEPTASGQPTVMDMAKEVVVEFDGKSFSPETVSLKAGGRLTINNKSNVNMWPASNDHPTHKLYPEFDSLKPILPGESYTLILSKAGTWGYHDHLQPTIKGQIVIYP